MTDSTDASLIGSDRNVAIGVALIQLAREVGPAADLHDVLERVVTVTRQMLPFERMIVHLRLGSDHSTTVAAVSPPDGGTPSPSDVIARRVVSSGQAILVRDAEDSAEQVPEGVRSLVAVPLISLGEVTGALEVHHPEPGQYRRRDVILLEALAVQVAGSIESARRYAAVVELETMKSDFIARVSHELRTPITIASGFLSTLLAGQDRISVDDQRTILERVEVAVGRLSELIDELLTLGQLEAGALVATPIEGIDLRAIAEEVRDAQPRSGLVTVEAVGPALVTTDPDLVTRALTMLVDNAIKYAGSCLIHVHPTCIEIVDRGPGIDVAHRMRVFETFTRASSKTTVPGMGIGLPMARTLLAAAGAELRMVDPVGGVGTTLVVEFNQG